MPQAGQSRSGKRKLAKVHGKSAKPQHVVSKKLKKAESGIRKRNSHPSTRGRSHKVSAAINRNIEDIMKARLIHHGQKLRILKAPKDVDALYYGEKGPNLGKKAALERRQAGGLRRAKEMAEKDALERQMSTKRGRMLHELLGDQAMKTTGKSEEAPAKKSKDKSKLANLWKEEE